MIFSGKFDKMKAKNVEKCSKMEFDYSNGSELKNLKIKYNELKELYDNILYSVNLKQEYTESCNSCCF